MPLSTKRLDLPHYAEGDFSDYRRMVQNPAVMEYITGHPLSEEVTTKKFAKVLRLNSELGKLGVYKVLDRASGDFVGLAKLTPLENRGIEIGYTFLPEWWGRGFATEIVERLLQLLREETDHRLVTGIIDPANGASKKVLTKFGFEFECEEVYDGLFGAFYQLQLPD